MRQKATYTIYRGHKDWPYDFERKVEISPEAAINPTCVIEATGGIVIGRWTELSDYVCIYTHYHLGWEDSRERRRACQKIIPVPLVIGEDVFIGAGAKVVNGNNAQCRRIGNGAIIGANAVVTHDVGDYEIWHGIPARKVGIRGG